MLIRAAEDRRLRARAPSSGRLSATAAAISGLRKAAVCTAAAIARALGAAGADVVVTYLSDRDAAGSVVAGIGAAGSEGLALQADVSREDDVERLFTGAVERFGTVDILVNNAGIQKDVPFAEMPVDAWRVVIDVNLTGQFLCARAAVREFLRRGRRGVSRALGRIICISSVHERIPWACRVSYAASKGGVDMMMRSLAQEVAGQGIRVNGIAPGAIKTGINRDAWEEPEAEANLLKLIPYGRVGEAGDVAKAAVWLGSDESDYVAGAMIYVDGGMALYPGFAGGG